MLCYCIVVCFRYIVKVLLWTYINIINCENIININNDELIEEDIAYVCADVIVVDTLNVELTVDEATMIYQDQTKM